MSEPGPESQPLSQPVSQPVSQAVSQPVSQPLSSRRRELGAPSAPALLLTVLGEFVHPRPEPVWTSTLLEAMGALGVEERSARQALARTAGEGILDSSRHGRRVRWRLTDDGSRLLDEGTRRIYGFRRERRPWDGRWLVLSVPVPEPQRQLRHRLRTRLTWLGLGSPAPGVWVTPHASREVEVAAVVRELGLDDQALAWAGPSVAVGDERRLLADAWDLAQVEQRYVDFTERFESRSADDHAAAFVAQVELVQEWRGFPFLDPDLPAELLHPAWPGPRAAATFHDRHARWHRAAQAEWERMADRADPAR